MKVSVSKVYQESVHINYDKLHRMAYTYRYARSRRSYTGREDKFSFRVSQSIPNFILRNRRRRKERRKIGRE
jgi:hypothetical protein